MYTTSGRCCPAHGSQRSRGMRGREEAQEGGHMCTHIANSPPCTAETHTTL